MGMMNPHETSFFQKPTDKRNKACTAIGKSLKAIRIEAGRSQETLAFDAEIQL